MTDSDNDWNTKNKSSGPLMIVPGQTDKELADEFRLEIQKHMEPLLITLTKAKSLGFEVTFNIQTDALGKCFLGLLRIMKEY